MGLIWGLTPFDIAAGLVLLVSGVIGYARGATRELTTMIAFVLAALAAVIGLRFTEPVAGHFIHTLWVANTAAVLVTFIAAYIALRMIGGAMTRGVQRTALSGVDRVLGLAIGLIRGMLVIGVFALLFEAATPPERMPAWIAKARFYPMAQASAQALQAVAPQGMRAAHEVLPEVTAAVEGVPPPKGGARPAGTAHGYSNEQRHALDVLVEKSR
jgi:membrane protein required for colicin V production